MKRFAKVLTGALVLGLGAAACGVAPDGEPLGSASSELAACAPPSIPSGTVTPTCSATVQSGTWSTPTTYLASCKDDANYPYTPRATCNFGCNCGATIKATVPACPNGGSLGTNSAGPCTPSVSPSGGTTPYNQNWTLSIAVKSCSDTAANEAACKSAVNAKYDADPNATQCVSKYCAITPSPNAMQCCSAVDSGASQM